MRPAIATVLLLIGSYVLVFCAKVSRFGALGVFGFALLGCGAPITKQLLHQLNPDALQTSVCSKPDGMPDAHFWAVRFATGEVISDREPDRLKQFVPVADAIYEYSCANGVLPTRAEAEAERVRLAMPPRQYEVSAAAVQS